MPEPAAHDPIQKEFGFDGAWMPDFDPSKMGEKNFAELKNLRYVEDGIEPIEGYTALTTNPCDSTYNYIRDGIQLRQNIGTEKSFVIVYAWNSGETAARIWANTTAIPTAGDFSTTALFTPDSPVDPRFGALPRGIGFCSEQQTCVYEGDEAFPGVVLLVDSVSGLSYTNPRDYTKEMTDSLSSTNHTMALAGSALTFVIGTTRPLKGFKVYVKTANGTASTMTVKEWTSGAWTAVTGLVDGTSSGSVSLAQTGTVTFDTTVGSSDPCFIDNVYLYHYQVSISAGGATLYQITVDMPFQEAVDIWDGVFRTCISYQVSKNAAAFDDYTLEVNEESNVDYPITARMQNFRQNAADALYVASEEQASAMKVEVLGSKQNTDASTLTIYYWDGDSWVSVGTVYDGTLDSGGTKTFNQSGIISWKPPARQSERMQTLYGVSGYFYKVVASAQWTADVQVDFFSFVPAPKEVTPHKFAAKFVERAFFGGDVVGGEPNALDYTASHTIDVHNGLDSSDRGQRIYIGGRDELTAARSVYNRFGSSIYETLLAFKNSETYLLTGSGPLDFRLFRVSENYGCPAPRTLVGAEIGYEMSQGGVTRNIVIWLSYRGPIIFDGAVITPIPGIDLYFDTRKDTVINFDYIQNCVAWFDPFWKEFHLMIPSGSSQTTLNVHLVYDLARKKWWKVNYDGGASDIPQFGMTVQATTGATYPYVFRNDGHMLRFGYGSDWNGNDLTHLVKTADIMPGGMWNLTQLLALKLGHQVPDFSATSADVDISINMYINGASTATALDTFTLARSDYVEDYDIYSEASEQLLLDHDTTSWLVYERVDQTRYRRHVQALNQIVHSVQFEFSRTSTSASYLGNFGKSFLWWGFLGAIVGRDERGQE